MSDSPVTEAAAGVSDGARTSGRHSWPQAGPDVVECVVLAVACLITYWLTASLLSHVPFHAWALAVLVGASALAVMLLGRPGDAVTAGITTAVIMVVAAVSPQHAWQQPFSAWWTPS
jgi:hypothetical protein